MRFHSDCKLVSARTSAFWRAASFFCFLRLYQFLPVLKISMTPFTAGPISHSQPVTMMAKRQCGNRGVRFEVWLRQRARAGVGVNIELQPRRKSGKIRNAFQQTALGPGHIRTKIGFHHKVPLHAVRAVPSCILARCRTGSEVSR